MKVSFSFGKKSTTTLINTLKHMADNVEFYPYNSIGELVKESQLRKLFFDRIVFSEKILTNPKKELATLNDYIRDYSNSTEIVMVANPKGSKAVPVFTEIFDSPMYTPVIVEKPTPTSLLELVNGDVLELKTKYFVLDVSKGDNKKKGLFGGFKNTKNVKVEKNVQNVEVAQEPENLGESSPQNYEETSSATPMESNTIPSENVGMVDSSMGVNGFGFGFSGNIPNSAPNSDFEPSNSSGDFEDDGLSLGDFGSQHSDTGYLDEEGESELQRFAESQEANVQESEENMENYGDYEESEDVGYSEVDDDNPYGDDLEEHYEESEEPAYEQPKSQRVQGSAQGATQGSAKTFILMGIDGVGVTQMIVDKAVKLAERGVKTLIVDLDTKTNGVLSYIDTSRFYISKCQNGISNRLIYSEDGVDVVSNGYGCSLTKEKVKSLLDDVSSKYSNILIDCPIESIKYLPMGILQKSNLCILVNGERSSLISTSLALTDRGNLSLEAERCVMEGCSVKVVGDSTYLEEDLNYLRETCYFPNGSWLNNIS